MASIDLGLETEFVDWDSIGVGCRIVGVHTVGTGLGTVFGDEGGARSIRG